MTDISAIGKTSVFRRNTESVTEERKQNFKCAVKIRRRNLRRMYYNSRRSLRPGHSNDDGSEDVEMVWNKKLIAGWILMAKNLFAN